MHNTFIPIFTNIFHLRFILITFPILTYCTIFRIFLEKKICMRLLKIDNFSNIIGSLLKCKWNLKYCNKIFVYKKINLDIPTKINFCFFLCNLLGSHKKSIRVYFVYIFMFIAKRCNSISIFNYNDLEKI